MMRAFFVGKESVETSVLVDKIRTSGVDLVETCSESHPEFESFLRDSSDSLIIGVDRPDRSLLTLLSRVQELGARPVVVFAKESVPDLIEALVQAGASALILDDVPAKRIPTILSIASARFREQQSLRGELEQARSKLAERKVLDKAKGLLMQQKGLSEDEAYRSLRKMAMDKGLPIAQVAQNLIDVFYLLDAQGCA